jgi:hypothetical protein
VSRCVAEEDRNAIVGERNEVVDVAADCVRDLVVRGDLEIRRLRWLARDQVRLQVARELELVAELDLVDQLHRKQKREHEESRDDLDERPQRRIAHLPEDRREADEKRDPRQREKHAPVRGEPLGEAEHHRARGADDAAEAFRLAVDHLAVIGNQRLPRLRPLVGVEIGDVARLQRVDRVSSKL